MKISIKNILFYKVPPFLFLFFIVFFVLTFFGVLHNQNIKASFSFPWQRPQKELTLSQEDLVALTKPAIVRVVQHNKGKALVPDFNIDINNLSATIIPNKTLPEVDYDQYLEGSGFIVSGDGYILTNAHVVSDTTIKALAVVQAILPVMVEKLYGPNNENKAKLDELEKDSTIQDKMANLGQSIARMLIKETFLTSQKEITVLNPSSTKDNLQDIISESFEAKEISVNNDFYLDQKDVALIKIDQTNLPSIPLGDSTSLTTGNKIFVFGFPGTADLNSKNLLESTFTQGTISAIKDSDNKDFKIFQTDAKVSEGSSGGPLINEKAQVVGLVTYQTDPLSQASGDNFAFATPIEIAKQAIDSVGLTPGTYFSHFQNGLQLMQNQSCKKAEAEFDLAKNVNHQFAADKYVSPYIDKCNNLIAAGQSIDSALDEFSLWLKGMNYVVWVIVALILIVFSALIFFIIRLGRRVKKEETEIKILESSNTAVNQEPVNQNVNAGNASAEISSKNSLVDYIKNMRSAGVSDDAIFQELKKAGWADSDIQRALSSR